jgi:hypothetical protein
MPQLKGNGAQSAIVQAVKPAIPLGLMIRPMRASNAEQVLETYEPGLDTGQVILQAHPGMEARRNRWDQGHACPSERCGLLR